MASDIPEKAVDALQEFFFEHDIDIELARAALAAALAHLPQGDGWRDIASAPKDGTDILLAAVIGGVWRQKVGWWEAMDNAWVTAIMGSGRKAWLQNPTHWQPLPPSPSSAITDQEAR